MLFTKFLLSNYEPPILWFIQKPPIQKPEYNTKFLYLSHRTWLSKFNIRRWLQKVFPLVTKFLKLEMTKLCTTHSKINIRCMEHLTTEVVSINLSSTHLKEFKYRCQSTPRDLPLLISLPTLYLYKLK